MNTGVDDLLFHLVILGSIVDSNGYVWLRSEHDLYAIEVMPLQWWEIDSSVCTTHISTCTEEEFYRGVRPWPDVI